jgi:hypothetical protein
VPDRSSAPESLYLPFADTRDDKASVLLSKILMLINDDQIEDPSIVAQIEVARKSK